MKGTTQTCLVAVLLVVTVSLQTGWPQSAQKLVHEGNKLYAQGKYNQAINKYDQALLKKPDALEAKFNKANSYYRLDDLAKAMELYREVAAGSKDMKLVARARYNLGNCCFRQGLKQRDSDLQKALDALKDGIVHWRKVLEVEPDNEKAAKNIEVARLIIKDMLDELNKQRQQQKRRAEKQKQLRDELKELLQRQKQLAEQTQQTSRAAEKGDISQQQAGENYTRQADEQARLARQSKELSERLRQVDPNTPTLPQAEHAAGELDTAWNQQQQAEQQLRASNGKKARQSQDRAVEHLENALKALAEAGRQNQQGQGQQAKEQSQNQAQAEQRNQQSQDANQPRRQQEIVTADATAQEILDKEKREKQLRQIRQMGGYQKVEKDW